MTSARQVEKRAMRTGDPTTGVLTVSGGGRDGGHPERRNDIDAVNKELKKIPAKPEMPGFRKAKVPAG